MNPNDDLMNKILAARQEEAQKCDFPQTDSLMGWLTLLQEATAKAKILELTGEFDTLVKLGWGWRFRHLPDEVARPLIEEVYAIAMAKRASVCPPYNDLVALVEEAKTRYRAMGQNEAGPNGEVAPDRKLPQPFYTAVSSLKAIARLLREPHLVGLYEESEFPTLRQEVRCHFTFIKKAMRRQSFPTRRLEELQAQVRDGLNRRSGVIPIQAKEDTDVLSSNE